MQNNKYVDFGFQARQLNTKTTLYTGRIRVKADFPDMAITLMNARFRKMLHPDVVIEYSNGHYMMSYFTTNAKVSRNMQDSINSVLLSIMTARLEEKYAPKSRYYSHESDSLPVNQVEIFEITGDDLP